MLKYALIPLLPLAAFLVNGLFGKWTRDRAHIPAIGSMVVSFGLAALTLAEVYSGAKFDGVLYSWISSGGFDAHIGFKVDALTAVMLIVVTTISLLVQIYSSGYMHGDPGYPRFFAYLSLFTFSMLMLVMADNFLQLYVFWEAVGLCSYFLIGFWYEKKSATDAGKKAFVVNRIGDFGFGLGVMLIFITFGTLNYDAVFSAVPQFVGKTTFLFGGERNIFSVIALLLFMGAMGKSAQLPLHTWLPDAMEGPTPVSALIHAATMVTAGIFMVARCHPLFAQSQVAMDTVVWTGGLTAIFAASIALTQFDIKRVIAYSTMSQLGYMFVACGVGVYSAGIFHLMTHAFFKGLLFLGAGSVIHALGGEQDMRKMGGLRKKLKWTFITLMAATLAISGIPPFAGFFSKDEILLAAYSAGPAGHAVFFLLALAALITSFYSFRLIFMTFFGEPRDKHIADHAHESPASMLVPLIILGFLSVTAGWVAHPFASMMSTVFGGPHEESPAAALVMGLSVAIGLFGALSAWFMYIKRPELPGKVAKAAGGLYTLLFNKYYVDEIYDALFVNPCKRLARNFLWAVVDV
ncbi:MAG TPA: NADH-quinone oxidoreductase subunit L, partial [Nitrospirota bacterium]